MPVALRQAVLDAGAVPRLVALLGGSTRERVRKEAAWILSNVAAGSRTQVRCATTSHISG